MENVKALASRAAAFKAIYGPASPEAEQARQAYLMARFAGLMD